MKMINKYIVSDKNRLPSYVSGAITVLLCLFAGLLLLIFPQRAKEAVSGAIQMCSETVIPSLFPFLFLSAFISESGILCQKPKYLSVGSEKLLKIPYEGVMVFLLSALGGFPVGAKTANNLYLNKTIGKETMKKLVFSCVNPSPAFAVTAVGLSLFSSPKAGLIIYFSVILSNLLLLFLSRFIFDEDEKELKTRPIINLSLSSAFVDAGRISSENMIYICGFVLLFSCVCELTKEVLPGYASYILSGILEVTVGSKELSFLNNIPLIAGLIGWGGLSVHFQIMDCIRNSEIGLKIFFLSRCVCAFLSVFVCGIVLYFFPLAESTATLRSDIIISTGQSDFPVSVMMLLTCFVFLIGDTTIKLKKRS